MLAHTIALNAIVAAPTPERAESLAQAIRDFGDKALQSVHTSGPLLTASYGVRYVHPDMPDAAGWPATRRTLAGLLSVARTHLVERVYIFPSVVPAPETLGGLEDDIRTGIVQALDEAFIAELDAANRVGHAA